MVDALLGISNVSANALLVLLCLRCFRILLTIGVDTHFFIDLVDIRMHYAFDLMNKYEQDPTPRVAIITSMRGGTPYAKDRPYIATVFVNNVGGSTFHVLMPPNCGLVTHVQTDQYQQELDSAARLAIVLA